MKASENVSFDLTGQNYIPEPPALPANLQQVSINQKPYYVSQPLPYLEVAIGFTVVLPLGLVHDPDNDPSVKYIEVEKDNEFKISIFDENFFDILAFLEVNFKFTATS